MPADPVSAQIQTTFTELWKLSPSELELELGRRLALTREEVRSATELTSANPIPPSIDTAPLAGPVDFLRDLARTFLQKFNQQVYSLVCDPNDPDHEEIRKALAAGAERLGLVLSGVLAASFGWLPGIAGVVAVLVAKRFVKAGHQAVCESWRKELG